MSAAHSLPPADTVEVVLAKIKDIAVLPQVVFKIMEMTGNEAASAGELESAIIVDPGFSAKLLALANSASFSLPKKVTSIREAVMFIGLRQVRQTAMAVGVFDMFVGKTDKESLRRRSWWRQSVDTALCARSLSERFNAGSPELAYTTGLLHLIGKTLLDRYESKEYEKVTLLCERGVTDFQAEQAVYGCHHILVAEGAAKKWGFPEELAMGLNYMQLHEDPKVSQARAILAVSHRIASIARDGADGGANLPEWAVPALPPAAQDQAKLVEAGLAAIAAGAHLHM